jgi:hypothetical protein
MVEVTDPVTDETVGHGRYVRACKLQGGRSPRTGSADHGTRFQIAENQPTTEYPKAPAGQ